MNVNIPQDVLISLEKASKMLHKDKPGIVLDALRIYLEDLEDAQEAHEAHQEWIKSGKKKFPLNTSIINRTSHSSLR